MEILFWILLFIVFYAYVGYGILLWVLVRIKQFFISTSYQKLDELPHVTLLVAAYNEQDCVLEKAMNSLALDYPKEKLNIVFVTDGSTDKTPEILRKFSTIKVYHQPERKGKMAAINRIMPLISTPITIFTDANALLNKSAVKEMVAHFSNPKIGVVAGEKRIFNKNTTTAEIGEGLYWKYESFLKNLDAKLYSTVGAAGELYAIRTELFEELEADTLLDDFVLSLRICQKNYVTVYEPNAYALETASAAISEEFKRKIRISAGGFQSIGRLKALLNPFRFPWLTFQYISHRVLRWAIVPFGLLFMLLLNAFLITQPLFIVLFIVQILFYTLAILGYYFEQKGQKRKAFYIPYYFSFMNVAALMGFVRFLKNNQSVLWEKAARTI